MRLGARRKIKCILIQLSAQPLYNPHFFIFHHTRKDWTYIFVYFSEIKELHKHKKGRLDEAPVTGTNREISSKWAQQRLEGGDEAQTACWTTDECTKRIDRQTDESNDGESNSSASGVKAFPYEPGFKILGCQKNSHTWHNVRNRPNAFNCNSASFSSFS